MYRIFLGLVLAVSSVMVHAAQPAEIVSQRTDAVLSALATEREAFKADSTKLRAFVNAQLTEVMDRTYAAQLVLARHARTASKEQISAFADALTDSLLRRYADALLELDTGMEVSIVSSTPMRDGQLMRVASRIVRKAGEPVQVDYMFRKQGDEWLVFDVIVEGISYVQTYRGQFDEQLRKHSLDEVIVGLRTGSIQLKGE